MADDDKPRTLASFGDVTWWSDGTATSQARTPDELLEIAKLVQLAPPANDDRLKAFEAALAQSFQAAAAAFGMPASVVRDHVADRVRGAMRFRGFNGPENGEAWEEWRAWMRDPANRAGWRAGELQQVPWREARAERWAFESFSDADFRR